MNRNIKSNPRADTRGDSSSFMKSYLTEPSITTTRASKSRTGASSHRMTTGEESRAASRSRALSIGPAADRVICAIAEGRGVATVVGMCFIIPSTCELIMSNVALLKFSFDSAI